MSNTVKALYVEILSSCNCRCTYCYNESITSKNIEINTEIFSNIIQQVKEMGLSKISISGGEPFMHPNIIDFIDISIKQNVMLNIITNLTIFEKELYDLLIQHNISLQVTIDGPIEKIHDYTRGKGTFNKTINNLNYLKEQCYSGFLTIRMNLHKQNYTQIEDLVSLAKTFNCSMINLSLINKVGAAIRFNDIIETNNYDVLDFIKKQSELLSKKFKTQVLFEGLNPSIGCPYYGEDNIECGLRISPNADVFPCQLFTDKIFSIGNVKNNSLTEIVNGDKMKKFKTLLSLRKTFIPECSECAYQMMCSTGCPAEAFNNNQNIFTNCGKCDLNKSVFKNFISYQNKTKKQTIN